MCSRLVKYRYIFAVEDNYKDYLYSMMWFSLYSNFYFLTSLLLWGFKDSFFDILYELKKKKMFSLPSFCYLVKIVLKFLTGEFDMVLAFKILQKKTVSRYCFSYSMELVFVLLILIKGMNTESSINNILKIIVIENWSCNVKK